MEVFHAVKISCTKYGYALSVKKRMFRRKIMCKFIQLPGFETWKILFFQPVDTIFPYYGFGIKYPVEIELLENEITAVPIKEKVPEPYTFNLNETK